MQPLHFRTGYRTVRLCALPSTGTFETRERESERASEREREREREIEKSERESEESESENKNESCHKGESESEGEMSCSDGEETENPLRERMIVVFIVLLTSFSEQTKRRSNWNRYLSGENRPRTSHGRWEDR